MPAEMIKAGGRTIRSDIHKHINSTIQYEKQQGL